MNDGEFAANVVNIFKLAIERINRYYESEEGKRTIEVILSLDRDAIEKARREPPMTINELKRKSRELRGRCEMAKSKTRRSGENIV